MKAELENGIVRALVCAELAGTAVTLKVDELRALLIHLYAMRARVMDEGYCPQCEEFTGWERAFGYGISLERCCLCKALFTSEGVLIYESV